MFALLLVLLLMMSDSHATDLDMVWERVPDAAMSVSPYSVTHSADGKVIIVGGEGYVEGWRTRGLRRLWKVPVQRIYTRGVAPLHHSSGFIVGSDSGEVAVHDLQTGERTRLLGTLNGWVAKVAVSDDDQFVAATGMNGELGVWRLEDGRRLSIATEGAFTTRLEGLAFTHDAKALVVAGNFVTNGPVRIVDLGTGRSWTLPPSSTSSSRRGNSFTALGSGPDGCVERSAERAKRQNEEAGCGEPGPQAQRGRVSPYAARCSHGYSVDITPDDQTIAIGCWGGALEIRSLADGRVLWFDLPTTSWTGPVHFTPDGRSLIAGGPDGIRRYETATGTLRATLPNQRSTDISIAPNGRRLTFTSVGRARIAQVRVADLRSLDGKDQPHGAAAHLSFSPDGRVLSIGSSYSRQVVFRDSDSGAEVSRVAEWPCVGWGGVRFDRQMKHVLLTSCQYKQGVSVMSWPSLRPVPGLQDLATNGEGWFTADGEHLLVMDAFAYGAPKVYPVPSGKPALRDDVDPKWLDPRHTTDADVAQAQWGHRSVLLTHWLNHGQPMAPAVVEHGTPISALSGGFSADGTITVQLDGDSVVMFAAGFTTRWTLGHPDARAVAISPAGDRVAVGFADGSVRVYTLPSVESDPSGGQTRMKGL